MEPRNIISLLFVSCLVLCSYETLAQNKDEGKVLQVYMELRDCRIELRSEKIKYSEAGKNRDDILKPLKKIKFVDVDKWEYAIAVYLKDAEKIYLDYYAKKDVYAIKTKDLIQILDEDSIKAAKALDVFDRLTDGVLIEDLFETYRIDRKAITDLIASIVLEKRKLEKVDLGVEKINTTRDLEQRIPATSLPEGTARIEGYATYAGDKPLPNAQVTLVDPLGEADSAITDENGNYIVDVPSGFTYTVSIFCEVDEKGATQFIFKIDTIRVPKQLGNPAHPTRTRKVSHSNSPSLADYYAKKAPLNITPILFASGSFSPDNMFQVKNELLQISRVFSQPSRTNLEIHVVGFADEGSCGEIDPECIELSGQRADNIANFMIENGCSKCNIKAIAQGSDFPEGLFYKTMAERRRVNIYYYRRD